MLDKTVSHTLFESLYNELNNINESGTYKEEFINFIIWELFIVGTATLLHYERFKELHDLLVRPYFLRQDHFSTKSDAFCYFQYKPYFRIIEKSCKPKSYSPNVTTLAGDILVKREKKPILTKESISNADIVLFQLGALLSVPLNREQYPAYWFPTTYIYHETPQLIWQKLKSKAYCLKIGPLFGVKTVEQLKETIKDSTRNAQMSYPRVWMGAPGILNSIKIEEVGSMN